MRKNITLAVSILGASVASPALADSKMEIGAFLGLHMWNDNNELGTPASGQVDTLENSPLFGVRVARRLHSFVSAEGELGLSLGATESTNTDVVALGYRLHLMVHPSRNPNRRLEPFALVGVGGFTSQSSDIDVIGNDSDFVVHGGIGFKYRVGHDWGFRFDARVLVPPANEGLVTTDGEFLVGVYKTFPPKPAKPAPPKSDPEPQPTSSDHDGDSVADADDRCPNEPEDVDGFEDTDGCPEADNDQDRIADADDRCPTEPETVNSFQDEDGCPDEAPAAVKQFNGVIRGIDFQVGSDKLTTASRPVLDEAVTVLTEYPTVRLQIVGHSDSTGDVERNRELSRRRAEAVKRYLVERGIAADRLEAEGRGPDDPIADNGTEDGRARNRRVEFKLR